MAVPHPGRFVLVTGPFRGKWIRYRTAPRPALARTADCCRCGAQTRDAGVAGWYYCRAERRPGRQVCPGCAAGLEG